MASPYLIREARRLNIDSPAANEPLPGAAADHRANHYRFARTQREAGTDNLEWEARIRPMKPWLYWLAAGVCWAIFAAAIIRMALSFARAPDL